MQHGAIGEAARAPWDRAPSQLCSLGPNSPLRVLAAANEKSWALNPDHSAYGFQSM